MLQDQEPDILNGRSPKKTDSSPSEGDDADNPAHLPTPATSPKQATDDQLDLIAPGPASELASGQSEGAHDEQQDWEIEETVGKRRGTKGWEYNVVWANTWWPRSELGNAQRLLQEFESGE